MSKKDPIIEAKNVGIKFKLRGKAGGRGVRSSVMVLSSLAKRMTGKNEFWALRDINFTVGHGEILGVIGANGSGKSTLLRMIGGIYEPDEGEFVINGTVSTLLSLGAGFKDELSGIDNIYLSGVILGFKKDEVEANIDNIIEFSELGSFINEPVKNYSSGMRARLGFSIAVYLQRDVMLVDEILGVGDFRFRDKSEKRMKEIIKSDQTVIIVSHNLDDIKEYATKAIWIQKGELMAAGPTGEIVEKYLENG